MSQPPKADAAQMLLDMLAGWQGFVANLVDEPDPGPGDEEFGTVSYASYTDAYLETTFGLYQQAGEVFMRDDPEMTPEEFIHRYVFPVLSNGG